MPFRICSLGRDQNPSPALLECNINAAINRALVSRSLAACIVYALSEYSAGLEGEPFCEAELENCPPVAGLGVRRSCRMVMPGIRYRAGFLPRYARTVILQMQISFNVRSFVGTCHRFG